MLIGVFSDVHDNLSALGRALEMFRSEGATRLIFCGDFCSPPAAKAMALFDGTVDCVFGNNDGDRFAIAQLSFKTPNLILHGEHAELVIDAQVKVAVTHYPLYGRALAYTGDYNIVFSGHTHKPMKERIKNTLWVNPGEVAGMINKPTVVLFDTVSRAIREVCI
jgi:uncharacterized protein